MPFITFIYKVGKNRKTYYGKYCFDYISDDNEVKYILIKGLNEYRKNNIKLDRENKNGKLILARNGIEHAVGKWNLNEPRITIAYNLNPVSDAQKIHNSHMPNMLMPLI